MGVFAIVYPVFKFKFNGADGMDGSDWIFSNVYCDSFKKFLKNLELSCTIKKIWEFVPIIIC